MYHHLHVDGAHQSGTPCWFVTTTYTEPMPVASSTPAPPPATIQTAAKFSGTSPTTLIDTLFYREEETIGGSSTPATIFRMVAYDRVYEARKRVFDMFGDLRIKMMWTLDSAQVA